MFYLRMLMSAAVVGVAVAVPSAFSQVMQAKSMTCQRLCHDGLGGLPCGCDPEKVALNFSRRMNDWRKNHPDEHVIKGPRRQVCPLLCKLNLGEPLCACPKQQPMLEEDDICPLCEIVKDDNTMWKNFGCDHAEVQKECSDSAKKSDGKPTTGSIMEEIKSLADTQVDWNLWCHIQCDQGTGGIACNCDMLPLVH